MTVIHIWSQLHVCTLSLSLPHLQRRGGTVDLHTDRRGVLWILDEESVFPGASESSFLDRVHMYHGETDEKGERSWNHYVALNVMWTINEPYWADLDVTHCAGHTYIIALFQDCAGEKCLSSIWPGSEANAY